MTQEYAVRYFVGKDGFGQIEKDWNVVIRSLSKKKFFHRYEWYKCYMEALKPKEETVYFFIIYNKDRPLAIFPLRKGIRNFCGIKLKVWDTPFHYHFVFSDFIYNVNDNKELLTFFVKYLSNNELLKRDALILHNVLEDSTVLHSLKEHVSLLKVTKHLGECSYIITKDFKKEAKRKKSKSINKQRKQLQKLGKVEFTRAVEKNDLLRDFNIFMDVESSGWKGAQGTAIKCNKELVKFYRCLITEFMNIGGCHICLLKINNECIAANFSILDDETIYSLKIGYREDYARYSPGTICRDNYLTMISEYDHIEYANFVTHQDSHNRWNPHLCSIYNVYFFNLSIGGIYVYIIEKGKQWMKAVKSKVD